MSVNIPKGKPKLSHWHVNQHWIRGEARLEFGSDLTWLSSLPTVWVSSQAPLADSLSPRVTGHFESLRSAFRSKEREHTWRRLPAWSWSQCSSWPAIATLAPSPWPVYLLPVHCCLGSFTQFKRGGEGGVVSSSLDLPRAPMHEGNSVCAGFTLSGYMNAHCQFHLLKFLFKITCLIAAGNQATRKLLLYIFQSITYTDMIRSSPTKILFHFVFIHSFASRDQSSAYPRSSLIVWSTAKVSTSAASNTLASTQSSTRWHLSLSPRLASTSERLVCYS